jgi:hypothetical protein
MYDNWIVQAAFSVWWNLFVLTACHDWICFQKCLSNSLSRRPFSDAVALKSVFHIAWHAGSFSGTQDCWCCLHVWTPSSSWTVDPFSTGSRQGVVRESAGGTWSSVAVGYWQMGPNPPVGSPTSPNGYVGGSASLPQILTKKERTIHTGLHRDHGSDRWASRVQNPTAGCSSFSHVILPPCLHHPFYMTTPLAGTSTLVKWPMRSREVMLAGQQRSAFHQVTKWWRQLPAGEQLHPGCSRHCARKMNLKLQTTESGSATVPQFFIR